MFTLIPSAPKEIQLNFVKSCLALAPGGPQMGTKMLDGRRGLFRSYALNVLENKKGGQRDPERDCHGHVGLNLGDFAPFWGQSGPNLETILGRCVEDLPRENQENRGQRRSSEESLKDWVFSLLGLLAGPWGTQEHRPLRAAGWKIKFCAVRGPPKSSQLSEVLDIFLAGECSGDPLTAQWASKLRMGL